MSRLTDAHTAPPGTLSTIAAQKQFRATANGLPHSPPGAPRFSTRPPAGPGPTAPSWPRHWFRSPRWRRNQQCNGTLLSRRWNNVSGNLYILAQDGMAKLTIRTPQRKPQCAQSPHLSFGSVNAAVYDPGGGRTMINQQKARLSNLRKKRYHLRRATCSIGNSVC